MVLPYSFNQQGNDYRFDTDKGIFYSVLFSDGSFYFADLPPHIPVFEVSISTVSLGDHISPPRDPRVEATIVEVFRLFFSDHENSIVYISIILTKNKRLGIVNSICGFVLTQQKN